ncbi:MAG: hypothetical protein CVV63_03050, partial [Tenericutes bacterium HGW-Tenericutes-8]
MSKRLTKNQLWHDLIYMGMDAFLIVLSYLAMIFMLYVIRMEFDFEPLYFALPFVVVFKVAVMYLLGIYRMLSKHVGFEDVMRIVIASTISNLLIVVYIASTNHLFMFKSAFFFITPVEIVLLTVPRVLNRIRLFFKTNMFINPNEGRRTLIIGAGSAGELVLREIYRNKDLTNHPVAFLDDNPAKI